MAIDAGELLRLLPAKRIYAPRSRVHTVAIKIVGRRNHGQQRPRSCERKPPAVTMATIHGIYAETRCGHIAANQAHATDHAATEVRTYRLW